MAGQAFARIPPQLPQTTGEHANYGYVRPFSAKHSHRSRHTRCDRHRRRYYRYLLCRTAAGERPEGGGNRQVAPGRCHLARKCRHLRRVWLHPCGNTRIYLDAAAAAAGSARPPVAATGLPAQADRLGHLLCHEHPHAAFPAYQPVAGGTAEGTPPVCTWTKLQ